MGGGMSTRNPASKNPTEQFNQTGTPVCQAKRRSSHRRSHGEMSALTFGNFDLEERAMYMEASHMMEGDMLRLFRFVDQQGWILETKDGVIQMLKSILGPGAPSFFVEKSVLHMSQYKSAQFVPAPGPKLEPIKSSSTIVSNTLRKEEEVMYGDIESPKGGSPRWRRWSFQGKGESRGQEDTPLLKAMKGNLYQKEWQMDANQVLTALWNFCTMDRRNLVIFVYSSYDTTLSDHLNFEDIREMLHDLYVNEETASQSYNEFLLEVNGLAEGIATTQTVSLANFFSVIANRPSLMEPLFSLQKKLREGIIGEAFWQARESVRKELIGKSLLDSNCLEGTSNLKEIELKNKARRNSALSLGFVDLGGLSLPLLDLSSNRIRRNSNSSLSGRPSSGGSSGHSSSREILERPGSPPKPHSSRSTIFSSLSTNLNKNRSSKKFPTTASNVEGDDSPDQVDSEENSFVPNLSISLGLQRSNTDVRLYDQSKAIIQPGIKRKSLLRPSRFSQYKSSSPKHKK